MTVCAPELVETDAADVGITHLVCCNEDIAICGVDVSDQPFVGDDVPVDCVVCLDLTDRPCPRCSQ